MAGKVCTHASDNVRLLSLMMMVMMVMVMVMMMMMIIWTGN